MRSGRLVAATTKTAALSPAPCTPSISASSWLTTRSITPPESAPAPRAGASASISSKKTTQGAARRARANTSRTWRSLSPMYMLISSGPFTPRKLVEHSLATALASSVLPVPGGPYSRTPERCRSPPLNSAGCLRGSSTVSMMARLQSSRPPTSSHLVPEARSGAPTSDAALARVRRRAASRWPGPTAGSAPAASASALAIATASEHRETMSCARRPTVLRARTPTEASRSLPPRAPLRRLRRSRPRSSAEGLPRAISCVKQRLMAGGILSASSAHATRTTVCGGSQWGGGEAPPPARGFPSAASDRMAARRETAPEGACCEREPGDVSAGRCERSSIAGESSPAARSASSSASAVCRSPPPRSSRQEKRTAWSPSAAAAASAAVRRPLPAGP
mmetsp:Transcript_26635/g.63116  ORF Transcript_26635/g.63116 Transcript_26635/m.63116 type:complete len:393 (-) Transcript_26635:1403-2581(-)